MALHHIMETLETKKQLKRFFIKSFNLEGHSETLMLPCSLELGVETGRENECKKAKQQT